MPCAEDRHLDSCAGYRVREPMVLWNTEMKRRGVWTMVYWGLVRPVLLAAQSGLLPRLHRLVTTVGWAAGGIPRAGHSEPARRRCATPAPAPRAPAGLEAAEEWESSAGADVR